MVPIGELRLELLLPLDSVAQLRPLNDAELVSPLNMAQSGMSLSEMCVLNNSFLHFLILTPCEMGELGDGKT